MPFAFSESTTEVTIPFDYTSEQCWLESETVFQCTWRGQIEEFTVEDLKQFKDSLSEETYQSELDRLEAVPLEVEPELTEREKQIQQLENKLHKGEAKAKDSVLYHLLTQLGTCQQGMDSRTEGIQNAREFEISSFKQWNVNNVPYDSELGILVKSIEECEAQQVLAYNVVGAGYMNMVHGEDDIQYSLHQELGDHQAMNFDRFNENSFRVDMNGVCDNNQYDWNNRIMMGCEDTREYDGIIKTGTSGTISYFSQTLGEYQDYLNNNSRYATQADKDNAEKIAEPILKEMLEKNLWYYRD